VDIVKTGKIVASILVAVVGSVYFIEDRYLGKVDAKEMVTKLEKASVDSFQQQRQLMDLELLDLWKEKLRDVEKMLEKHPLSTSLKNRLEWIKNKIKRIEDRLYN